MDKLKDVFWWTLRRRFHFVPVLILAVFISIIFMCRHQAPEHYKIDRVFQISALGNWQEGLSFFSGGLVLIGNLFYSLAGEVLMQKIGADIDEIDAEIDEHKWYPWPSRKCPYIFKLGSLLVYIGLVITGCFQQSFNKPGHNIGIGLMGIGFLMIFLIDLCFLIRNYRRTPASSEPSYTVCCKVFGERLLYNIVGVLQILLFLIAFISSVAFMSCHEISKSKWERGKKAWELEREQKFNSSDFEECPGGRFNDWLWRNETDYSNYQFECKSKGITAAGDPGLKIYKISTHEMANFAEFSDCPGKTVNDWLNGEDYPNFYPCKSKSLWAPDDPGWDDYEWSARFEVALFVALVLYTFTYLCYLDPEKIDIPPWHQQGYGQVGQKDKAEVDAQEISKAKESRDESPDSSNNTDAQC